MHLCLLVIQYEEDGHDVTQKNSIIAPQSEPAKNMNSLWLAETWPNKAIFEKIRMWDRFVIMLLSCDGPRINEIISRDIWESMISYEWKALITDGYFPTIPVP